MKKVSYFLMGASVGVVLSFALLYGSGLALEYMNVRLYESEIDQQRNFTIFITASALCSFFTGIFFARVYGKPE